MFFSQKYSLTRENGVLRIFLEYRYSEIVQGKKKNDWFGIFFCYSLTRTFIDQLMNNTRIRKEELGRDMVILWDPNYGKICLEYSYINFGTFACLLQTKWSSNISTTREMVLFLFTNELLLLKYKNEHFEKFLFRINWHYYEKKKPLTFVEITRW